MKTFVYLIFFSVISVMLLACSEDKEVNDGKLEHTAEAVTPAKKPESPPADVSVKKDEVVDPALSAMLQTGEKLVKQHCSSCHQTEIYTRPESKIKSADALLTQIKACDSNIGTALFDEDMAAIAAYLDGSFYKFAKEK